MLIGATLVQWPAWVAGTAIGALAVPSTSVIHTAGLDLVFPGFFVVLLVDTLAARPRLLPIALAAAAVAGAASRFLPGGVALLLAASAVLLTPLTLRTPLTLVAHPDRGAGRAEKAAEEKAADGP